MTIKLIHVRVALVTLTGIGILFTFIGAMF